MMKSIRIILLVVIVVTAVMWVTSYLMPVVAVRHETAIGAVNGNIVHSHRSGWPFAGKNVRLVTDTANCILHLKLAEYLREGSRAFVIPIWPIVAAAFPPWLILFIRHRRQRLRTRDGHCIQCGYDLTGNTSGKCSECGTATPTIVGA